MLAVHASLGWRLTWKKRGERKNMQRFGRLVSKRRTPKRGALFDSFTVLSFFLSLHEPNAQLAHPMIRSSFPFRTVRTHKSSR